MKISNIFKDANGKMGLLSLGTLYSETTVLSKDITLQNIGDLHSFAKIKVIPKGLIKLIFFSILITITHIF